MTARPRAATVPFPPLQRQAIDWLELNHRRHTMYGLIEVDVTETRRAIRHYRARTNTPLSLTAFIMYCFARAVDENKTLQASRLGRRRLLLFDEVDVASMVEREVNGFRIPVPHIVRAANIRSLGEIQREITAAQRADPETVAVSSVPSWLQPLMLRGLPVWLLLPAALRRLFWVWALHDPYRRKRIMGTVGLTAVSMFGHGTGWVVAPMAHPLTLAIGGLARKPDLSGTDGEVREYLCLTLTLDHDLIEGAPAARFARRLTERIEHAMGLCDQDQAP